MARAICFDLDGTLVDSHADIAAAGNAAREAAGLEPLPVATVAGFIGDGMGLLLDRLLAELDDPERDARARAAFVEHYAAHCCDETRAYPGVVECVAALAARVPIAVVTNKPRAFAERILAAVDLAAHCRAVIGGDEVRKPSPEPVLAALAACGAEPAGSYMVGDMANDWLSGRAAGCRTVYVTWSGAAPLAHGADARCADPAALREWLESDMASGA